MECYLCKGKGVVKQQKGRAICERCFCRIIEKRIRKYVRVNECFSNNDKVLVVGDLAKFFVESIVGERPLKLYFSNKEDKELIKKNNINKIAKTWTMDDEDNKFLESVFSDKSRKIDNKYVKMLTSITDEEASIFAKFKGIKFKPNKKNKDVMELMEELSKKHVHAKYSLIKNIRELDMLNRLT
jgi:hypothetical protein